VQFEFIKMCRRDRSRRQLLAPSGRYKHLCDRNVSMQIGPSVRHLELKNWILVKLFLSYSFCLLQSVFGSLSLIYAHITICILASGHPPSWTCDDVIILPPVIDFRGFVTKFYVDWSGSFRTNPSHMRDRRQTQDRRTDRHRNRLKPHWVWLAGVVRL